MRSTITVLALVLSACSADQETGDATDKRTLPLPSAARAEQDGGVVEPRALDAQLERPLSQLSSSELEAVCNEVILRYEAGISDATRARQRCLQLVTPPSLDATGKLDVRACDERLARCLAGESFPEPGPMDARVIFPMLSCDATTRGALSQCTALVVDFDRCFTAITALINEQGFKSCNSVSGPHSGTMVSLDQPPECDAIVANCHFLD